jgi:hypothetical protein
MVMNRLPHTVTVVEPTTSVDQYGVTVLTYNGPQTQVAAFVQPAASEQAPTSTQSTGRVLTRLKVYVNDPVPLNARVLHNAETFEVEGSMRWDGPHGQLHHYEVTLRQVEG